MSLNERTGQRTLIYSGWHRPGSLGRFIPKHLASRMHMIDIDACEYCDGCKVPLALIETQQSRSKPKGARVTCILGRMAGVPVYSVSYWCEGEADIEGFKVQSLEPYSPDVDTLTAAEYAQWLLDLRFGHVCEQRQVAS